MNHNGSLVLIRDRSGRILCRLRDDEPGIAWPGHWILPGGRQEPGESREETARREVREETGLDLRRLHRVHVRVVAPDTLPPAMFHARVTGEEPLVLGEGQALAWYHPDALPRPMPGPVVDYITQALAQVGQEPVGAPPVWTPTALVVEETDPRRP